jgi:hypothetical protein
LVSTYNPSLGLVYVVAVPPNLFIFKVESFIDNSSVSIEAPLEEEPDDILVILPLLFTVTVDRV